MPQKAVKCYGIRIDQLEIDSYLSCIDFDFDHLTEALDAVCAYQDQSEEHQIFIYKQKENAVHAVVLGRELGFESVELCPTLIYVPETDFMGGSV